MPSDAAPTFDDVLRPARDEFHSALAHTIEEVRTVLDARPATEEDKVADTGASLGAFASGRVDPQRFSALLSHSLTIDDTAAKRIERAFESLQSLNERLDGLLTLRVASGASLRDAVADRLAEIGCAFGAAHLVTAIRAGTYDEAEHADLLEAYPFARWSSTERALAPALLVEVDGADVRAAALTEFLDGRLRILLSVTGESPVAPLARLIAPQTYVLQTADAQELDGFASFEGAGIAAVVPEGAARFRHDPAADERLAIAFLPEDRPRPVGGTSTRQQEEDLALLKAWTCTGAAAAATPAAEAEDDIAGRLAGWLLQQANLNEDA